LVVGEDFKVTVVVVDCGLGEAHRIVETSRGLTLVKNEFQLDELHINEIRSDRFVG
jgi:hypothetical protein